MSKPTQIDLEDVIKRPQGELADAFTGEIFKPRARNHYEVNDGVPVAPQVELNRPSIRQRIENLINRDPAVLQRYLREGPPDGAEGYEMDVPDDPEAPLTPAEANYIEAVAADLAEAAPLPDEGLPRPDQPAPSPAAASKPADRPLGGEPAGTHERSANPGQGGRDAPALPAP